jgi:hypothetical protein
LFPHPLSHTLRERDVEPFSRRVRVGMRERLDVMGQNFKPRHYRHPHFVDRILAHL